MSRQILKCLIAGQIQTKRRVLLHVFILKNKTLGKDEMLVGLITLSSYEGHYMNERKFIEYGRYYYELRNNINILRL